MPIVIWSVVVLLALGLTLRAARRRRRRIAAMAVFVEPGQHIGGPHAPSGTTSYGVHTATMTGQGPTFGPMN